MTLPTPLSTLLRPVLLAPKETRELYFVAVQAADGLPSRSSHHYFVTATSAEQAADLALAALDHLGDTAEMVLCLGQPGVGAPLLRRATDKSEGFGRANVPRPARGILYYVDASADGQHYYFVVTAQNGLEAEHRVLANLAEPGWVDIRVHAVCYPSSRTPDFLALAA